MVLIPPLVVFMDPRWIVEEQADTSNVNNWHWVTAWSTEKLQELLLGVCVEGVENYCEVIEISKLEVLLPIGTLKSGMKCKGNVVIPNLSDENGMDDINISMSLCKDEPETPLTALMKKDGVQKIHTATGSFTESLLIIPEFTQGMILPRANGVNKEQLSQSKIQIIKTTTQTCRYILHNICRIHPYLTTDSINLKETFLTSEEISYKLFFNQEMVQAFTQAPAVVGRNKEGKFKLLHGNVCGEFRELVKQKIVIKWYFKTWSCDRLSFHYSTVTLDPSYHESETELKVKCKGVSVSERERKKKYLTKVILRNIPTVMSWCHTQIVINICRSYKFVLFFFFAIYHWKNFSSTCLVR
uniref:AHA1, activator of heat shock 1a n=1 Tax=Scleropages formosus TaxID=113540 RepID=A0A8C9RMN0_SCLFO